MIVVSDAVSRKYIRYARSSCTPVFAQSDHETRKVDD